jgi:hypothetical protein
VEANKAEQIRRGWSQDLATNYSIGPATVLDMMADEDSSLGSTTGTPNEFSVKDPAVQQKPKRSITDLSQGNEGKNT